MGMSIKVTYCRPPGGGRLVLTASMPSPLSLGVCIKQLSDTCARALARSELFRGLPIKTVMRLAHTG